MSTLKLKGSTSGYVELTAPATAGDNQIVLPTTAGTVAVKDASNNVEVGTGVTIGSPSSNTFTVSTNGSERISIDASGRLLVGTSTASGGNTSEIEVHNAGGGAGQPIVAAYSYSTAATTQGFITLNRTRGTSVLANVIVQDNDLLGAINWQGGNGSYYLAAASITGEVDGTPAFGSIPGALVFATSPSGASSPTERMRITSGGQTYWSASAPSASSFGTSIARIATGLVETFRNTDGTSSVLVAGGTAGYARIMGDGDLENTNNRYTGISDVKLKENIVDASSQWNDIKALRVRKYNLKAETGFNTHTQIGLIAQEAESVCPGLVNTYPDLDEEGNDLGTTTKSVTYSVLYMKAVKALQEAMERIEQLEAKVAALETK